MKLNIILISTFIISIILVGTISITVLKIHHDKDVEHFLELSPSSVDSELIEFEKNKGNILLNQIIFLTITTIILSIMVGFFINYMVGKPIGRITNTVDEISKGNLEIEIGKKELENKGEIGDLARSLNRVLASLKLAVLRKGPTKKENFDRPPAGISESDLVKTGLLANSKPKPKKEIIKKPISKSIAVIKDEGKTKKPLVTFPVKEKKEDKKIK